ncbi:MAG: fructose-bisphosphate aldolase class I [Planctomycetes bacterium]|nr:fructose-bisphosphate aldolase class I [Planctomycetota bacterium]
MNLQVLNDTARALVAPGKGILAADESTGTIEKRFKAIGVENTEPNRRDYRELMFTAPEVEKHISGVILYDETIRQKGAKGAMLAEILAKRGIIPGIKVDKGTIGMPLSPEEKVTEGLDGLGKRLDEYKALGGRFAKWRAVITIGKGIPSEACLRKNADLLAHYAAICQDKDVVPIVEPEVLMDGDHAVERCFEVTEATLRLVFAALQQHGVVLEGMLLKPNMVIAASGCKKQAGVEQVAAETLRCFRRTVPAAVPGIVFLSGGQSDEVATAHLSAMNRMGPNPWPLSFSYGRALQHAPQHAWKGQAANVAAAQKAFLKRAKCNGAAALGKYTEAMEKELVTA